jgi:hypothetical protein
MKKLFQFITEREWQHHASPGFDSFGAGKIDEDTAIMMRLKFLKAEEEHLRALKAEKAQDDVK